VLKTWLADVDLARRDEEGFAEFLTAVTKVFADNDITTMKHLSKHIMSGEELMLPERFSSEHA